MVATCKKKQSKRRLFSSLEEFDQKIIISNTINGRQGNARVNENTVDQDFTADNPGQNFATFKIR